MTAKMLKWVLLGLIVSTTLFLGASPARSSHYRLSLLELFEEAQLEALQAAEMVSTEDYLRRALTRADRQALSEATGISELEVLVFARLFELLQIEGVGPRAARLLRAGGVVSVEDLASRDAQALLERLVTVNAVEQLTGINPTVENLTAWIEGAQNVPYHVR